jgi:DMSO/TMAO reductase YedYZ molybdopterin-dependent catalytic subunit
MAEMLRSSSVGLIIRQKEPNNLETPFDQIDSFLTPTELFYIRSHFPAPTLDVASYQLRIDGAVSKPFSLSYKELRDMPSETRIATLECAGNSRVFLVPQARGAQWELGAVGNAEWTGVPLAALLERAGVDQDACEIVLEGADQGTPAEEPVPPDPISYARSLPRDKAMRPEVLIAYQMNGRDLSQDHGYPVRAIVPGQYGMASVKWLTHIHALREPFRGYWKIATLYSDTGWLVVLPHVAVPARSASKRSGPGVKRRLYTSARERDLTDTGAGSVENCVGNSSCRHSRGCLSRPHGAPVKLVDEDGLDFWNVGVQEQRWIGCPVG